MTDEWWPLSLLWFSFCCWDGISRDICISQLLFTSIIKRHNVSSKRSGPQLVCCFSGSCFISSELYLQGDGMKVISLHGDRLLLVHQDCLQLCVMQWYNVCVCVCIGWYCSCCPLGISACASWLLRSSWPLWELCLNSLYTVGKCGQTHTQVLSQSLSQWKYSFGHYRITFPGWKYVNCSLKYKKKK